MIPELGHYAVILALVLSLIQATVPLYGAARNNLACMQLSRYTAVGHFIFLLLAFSALAFAFLTNDFTVKYVAENSNTQLPFIYRFCAIWGAHSGSMLLWIFILSIWILAVSIFSRSLPLAFLARVLAVMAMIAVGFELYLLLDSNPFLRFLPNFPLNGNSLDPILQDPGLEIHPPMLYMGYVGLSVAFAFAIAALLSGRLDSVWARWSRPWTLIAWCFLTFGIVLGSWWAYRELGWGGWWFWDPVENASFLPWLVATALIHSLSSTERRDVFKAWTVLLAIIAFSLSLLGTFLVRSGILISVHAFAVDPKRGLYILHFLIIVIGASLILYAWRARRMISTGSFEFWSREIILLTNNIFLFVGMLTVLLGTLYPLVIAVLGLGNISVGAPYFNSVFVPLMLPMLFLMGIAPLFSWQKTNMRMYARRLILVFMVVILLAFTLPLLVGAQQKSWAILGLALALWIIINTLLHCLQWNKNNSRMIFFKKLSRNQIAMVFAHVGVAITVIGLSLTTAYSQQQNLSLKTGEQVHIGPYQITFSAVDNLKGPDYKGVNSTFLITEGSETIDVLHPQLREFPLQKLLVAKAAIDMGPFRDIYVALGTPIGDDAWSVRIYYKPFVRWIWMGGLFMMFGGILALSSRDYRREKFPLKRGAMFGSTPTE
jgi:cytochrome c-type biogenesis protein CcmF